MSAIYQELLGRATALIDEAEQRGVALRLVGSLACRVHCPNTGDHFETLGRELPHDLDFLVEDKSFSSIKAAFDAHGFHMNEQVAQASGRQQLLFRDAAGLDADVYVERLNYCHPIAIDGARLARDRPTIPLAELLLAKLQIVELTEKDVKDVTLLLLEHELADGEDHEAIDAGRVASILADDWGFHHTVGLNLDKVASAADRFAVLPDADRALVAERIASLRGHIDEAPKTRRWRMRARVGTRVRWYQEVEEKF